MRLLVCGSRDWNNPSVIWAALEEFTDFHSHLEVIHGAARGADTIAANCAKALGHEVIAVPAKWEVYGKGAGPIRNKEMLDMAPDVVVAFRVDGGSAGTDHMVKLAYRAGLPVRIYDIRGTYRDLPIRRSGA